jgi:hypothetical protein
LIRQIRVIRVPSSPVDLPWCNPITVNCIIYNELAIAIRDGPERIESLWRVLEKDGCRC